MSDGVSIITVVYNASSDLLRTIESVRKAKCVYENIEYLVVDGGSTDATVTAIVDNSDVVDGFISESDNGVFDAMNKGIQMASLKWLIFINAGDLILESSIPQIMMFDLCDSALVIGNTIRNNGDVTPPFELGLIECGALPACHQSMLFNSELLSEMMYYENKFSLFSENELFMRIYKSKLKISYVNVDISVFKGGGISDSVNSITRKAKYFYLYKHFGINGLFKGMLYKMNIIRFRVVQIM